MVFVEVITLLCGKIVKTVLSIICPSSSTFKLTSPHLG